MRFKVRGIAFVYFWITGHVLALYVETRELLFRKLERYGVRGVGLEFIKSYFSERKQYVRYKSSDSDVRCQNLGVIQGCKTGPLFWDIYSNEFNQLMDDDRYILYADDTSLVYVGNDLEALSGHVNDKLSIISDWCKFNKLSLNPQKSEYLLITNRKYISPALTINGVPLRQVCTSKYLGVYVDSSLKFSPQIQHVESKLSQYCGISYRL